MNYFDNKINLGVLFDQKPESGGGYQQQINQILLLKKLSNLKVYVTDKKNIKNLAKYSLNTVHIKPTITNRIVSIIKKIIIIKRNYIKSSYKPSALNNFIHKVLLNLESVNNIEENIAKDDVELFYFLSPSIFANNFKRINYIFTIWDISHIEQFEFPEVANSISYRREWINQASKKAIAVIIDSELAKKRIGQQYNIIDSRLYVMSHSPSTFTNINKIDYKKNYVDIKNKYKIKNPYIFYPAQFWAHKNHSYIIKSISILERKYGYKLDVIFSGYNLGNLSFLKSVVSELGLSKRIHFIGFADDNLMPYLYRQSIALVMPTYFGSTNIPPLDAFALEVPVIYSDLPGLRSQVNKAALLINLKSYDSLVLALKKIIEQPALRKKLIGEGKKMLALINDDKRIQIFEEIIQDFKMKKFTYSKR